MLTGSLDQAVRWGWRYDNPAKLATLPRSPGRRGEVAARRWSNIDTAAGELVISRALVERADLTILEKDTNTHQARRVAIDPGTVAALRTWRAEVERPVVSAMPVPQPPSTSTPTSSPPATEQTPMPWARSSRSRRGPTTR